MAATSHLAKDMAALFSKFDKHDLYEIFKVFKSMLVASSQQNLGTAKKLPTGNDGMNNKFSARGNSTKSRGELPLARPLNSWMAFRSFYSPIFKSVQQKDISGFLKELWAADPYKAKWAIISKAYSIIRDRVPKRLAPLDAFLSLVGPPTGAIDRKDYLAIMGWYFDQVDGKTVLKRAFVPTSSDIPQSYQTTSLSPEQLVVFCVTRGFVARSHFVGARARLVGLAMATRPSDISNPSLQNSTSATPSVNNNDAAATESLESQSPLSFQDLRDARADAVDEALYAEADPLEPSAGHFKEVVQSGLAITDSTPYGDIFDPNGTTGFPEFDPHRGFNDAVFDMGDPAFYIGSMDEDDADAFDLETYLEQAALTMNN